jgi:hypothetical protein
VSAAADHGACSASMVQIGTMSWITGRGVALGLPSRHDEAAVTFNDVPLMAGSDATLSSLAARSRTEQPGQQLIESRRPTPQLQVPAVACPRNQFHRGFASAAKPLFLFI